jgi:DNA-binding NtrC family response regulator
MPRNIDIFIIDDDAALGEMLSLHCDDLGYSVQAVTTATQAEEMLEELTPRLILLDQHLPDTHGLTLLPKLKMLHPDVPVLMITGKHDMQLAISAIKAGAMDYIHKPIDTDELDAALKKALVPEAAGNINELPQAHMEDETPNIIGSSRSMLDVAKTIALASQSSATVLVHGATGTGKELVAKAIHHNSNKTGPFLAVNCGAIVDNLLESEMFGHERGAFTGATERKEGKFYLAENGTLFLDEIGEMSPNLQSKLLRILQEQTYERVGGTQTLTTNARIIAATHRNLEDMIKQGTFRQDLYYRLKVITVDLPELKDRMEDLPLLVPHLLSKISHKLGKNIQGMTDSALYKLEEYSWPGNIRELENTLTRAAAINRTGVITPEQIHLHEEELDPVHHLNISDDTANLKSLEELEKDHVRRVLKSTAGHKGKASSILGISRPALDRKIKKYNL